MKRRFDTAGEENYGRPLPNPSIINDLRKAVVRCTSWGHNRKIVLVCVPRDIIHEGDNLEAELFPLGDQPYSVRIHTFVIRPPSQIARWTHTGDTWLVISDSSPDCQNALSVYCYNTDDVTFWRWQEPCTLTYDGTDRGLSLRTRCGQIDRNKNCRRVKERASLYCIGSPGGGSEV